MGDHSALHTTGGSLETSQSRSGTMVLQQSHFIEKSIETVPVISPDGFVDSSTLADATQACSKEGSKTFESWIRFIIKHSSRFQKVSQVVPVINRNTHLILSCKFYNTPEKKINSKDKRARISLTHGENGFSTVWVPEKSRENVLR